MTEQRNNSVLHSIIGSYIKTAEPVGSKLISELLSTDVTLKVSPATIRNTMAELEAEGLIEKTHSSSGRVPTEKGFRLYIDAILNSNSSLNSKDYQLQNFAEITNTTDANSLMHSAAHILSDLTHCTGIAVTQSEEFIIKDIRLFSVDREQVMLLALSTNGETFSKVTHLKKLSNNKNLKKLNFEAMTNYLNILGAGLTLQGLKIKILKELTEDKIKYDELLSKALELSSSALIGVENVFTSELLLDGTTNIFDQPEFSADIEKMKKLYKTFEEKNMILTLLDKEIIHNKTSVLMGTESNIEELKDLSFITTPYTKDGRTIGTLGVVGPVRMNYLSIIPLVRFTAGLIGKAI